MTVGITGIGSWSQAAPDWHALARWLRDAGDTPEGGSKPPAERIPPRERRRAPLSVKQAVEAAGQACAMAGLAPDALSCLFATGMGDMDITEYMCRVLVDQPAMLSPTKFHNSVHNAPVGYWSIATGARAPANTVSAFEYTAGMTLLEGFAQVIREEQPLLMVSQDVAAAGPLKDICPVSAPFAAALILQPLSQCPSGTPQLHLALEQQASDWPALHHPGLEDLYRSNPSARLLPLLQRLATDSGAPLSLPAGPGLSCRIQFTYTETPIAETLAHV